MLVVDRRDDPGAYAPGANRAQVQAELEKHADFQLHGVLESNAIPAQVEVEDGAHAHPIIIQSGAGGEDDVEDGVIVVTGTPGPTVLLELLTKRVWKST